MTAATNEYEEICARVEGTNINPTTLLATDYLNHFNEVIMLLEIVPDMPECIEDAVEWAPKTYTEHFRDSVFSDKELAIAAYEHVPAVYKQPFEDMIELMNALVFETITRMRDAIENDDCQAMDEVVQGVCRELRSAAESAGAIINGQPERMDQQGIDDLFA